MKKVIISQPRYLPALNYIQRLYFADIFVILDNTQRQSRGIENRNKILMQSKAEWLTVPIAVSSRELIKNAVVPDLCWIENHKRTIRHAYSKHPFYDERFLLDYYHGLDSLHYTQITVQMIQNLCRIFGFSPKLILASQLDIDHDSKGPEKLYQICNAVDAGIYISGPNGREYGVKEHFSQKEKRIDVVFHDFEYPVYPQYNNIGDFIPWLCFFDPLFNCGLHSIEQIIKADPVLSST